MTPSMSAKTQEVFDSMYKSLGGSGTNPDVAQFRTQLQNASPEQKLAAAKQTQGRWHEIITPLVEDSNTPRSIVEEVELFCEELVSQLQRAAIGAH